MNPIRVGGIVLCGGQSTRMGRAKASLPFGTEYMLQRVVRLLGETVAPVVVVAAQEQELPTLPAHVAVVRDEEEARGPLHGLAVGLAALRGRADAAFASGCDIPFLDPAFVRRVISLLGEDMICVPRTGDRYHPLAAVYRVEAAETAVALLARNRFRPVFLYESLPTRIATVAELSDIDTDLRSLRNLNTPEEYEQALRELSTEASHRPA